MVRPFLSLLLAGAATGAGLVTEWIGAGLQVVGAGGAKQDGSSPALAVAGMALVGLGAFSLALHWVGPLVVGSIVAVLGAFAVGVPLGNPILGGTLNPVFEIVGMLRGLDDRLGDASSLFFFTGCALVLGVFLAGGALAVRTRRISSRGGSTAVAASSSLGGLALVLGCGLLIFAGGHFATSVLTMYRYDVLDTVLLLAGSLLAGIGALSLRWSSFGAIVAGCLLAVGGLAGFLQPDAFPFEFGGAALFRYGLVALAGFAILGTAVAGLVPEPRRAVSASAIAL